MKEFSPDANPTLPVTEHPSQPYVMHCSPLPGKEKRLEFLPTIKDVCCQAGSHVGSSPMRAKHLGALWNWFQTQPGCSECYSFKASLRWRRKQYLYELTSMLFFGHMVAVNRIECNFTGILLGSQRESVGISIAIDPAFFRHSLRTGTKPKPIHMYKHWIFAYIDRIDSSAEVWSDYRGRAQLEIRNSNHLHLYSKLRSKLSKWLKMPRCSKMIRWPKLIRISLSAATDSRSWSHGRSWADGMKVHRNTPRVTGRECENFHPDRSGGFFSHRLQTDKQTDRQADRHGRWESMILNGLLQGTTASEKWLRPHRRPGDATPKVSDRSVNRAINA